MKQEKSRDRGETTSIRNDTRNTQLKRFAQKYIFTTKTTILKHSLTQASPRIILPPRLKLFPEAQLTRHRHEDPQGTHVFPDKATKGEDESPSLIGEKKILVPSPPCFCGASDKATR